MAYYLNTYWYPGEGEDVFYDKWVEVVAHLQGLAGAPPDHIEVTRSPGTKEELQAQYEGSLRRRDEILGDPEWLARIMHKPS